MASRPNLTNPSWMRQLQPPSPMTPKGNTGAFGDDDGDEAMMEDPNTARRRLMPVVGEIEPQQSTLEQVLNLLRQKVGA